MVLEVNVCRKCSFYLAQNMQAGLLITCKKRAFIQTKGELLRVKLKT